MKELTLDQISEGFQRTYELYGYLIKVLELLNPPRFKDFTQLRGKDPKVTVIGKDGFSPISHLISVLALELKEREETYKRLRRERE